MPTPKVYYILLPSLKVCYSKSKKIKIRVYFWVNLLLSITSSSLSSANNNRKAAAVG